MKKLLSLLMISASLVSFNASAQTATTNAPDATSATTSVATPATPGAPAGAATTPITNDTAAAKAPASTNAMANTAGANETKDNMENTLYLDLKDGRVVIQLLPEIAPNHVKRIKELVRQGFYDGVPFHRVIDGFMAQTGDPTGTGTGGSGQKIDAEFSNTKHVRGTVSMARAADPNSADSQFYIMFAESPHLDNNYTVFGKVTEGMEFVDKIKKGTGPNGMVSDPDKIIKVTVAADDKSAPKASTN